jgi:hypothetical protein
MAGWRAEKEIVVLQAYSASRLQKLTTVEAAELEIKKEKFLIHRIYQG